MLEESEHYQYNWLLLSDVYYNDGPNVLMSQLPALVPAFTRAIIDFAQYMSSGQKDIPQSVLRAANELEINTCRYKHRGFREEREIRIVACPLLRETSAAFNMKPEAPFKTILTRGAQEVRYIILGENNSMPITQIIDRIIVGPSDDQAALKERVAEIVPTTIPITCSETPLIW